MAERYLVTVVTRVRFSLVPLWIWGCWYPSVVLNHSCVGSIPASRTFGVISMGSRTMSVTCPACRCTSSGCEVDCFRRRCKFSRYLFGVFDCSCKARVVIVMCKCCHSRIKTVTIKPKKNPLCLCEQPRPKRRHSCNGAPTA